MADPDALLSFPSSYPLISGLLAGITLSTTQTALSNSLRYGPAEDTVLLTAAALAGAPLGAFIGIGIWRQTKQNDGTTVRPVNLHVNALLLAAGVIVGSHVALFGAPQTAIAVTPWSLTALVLCCLALVCWPHAVATTWRAASGAPGARGRLPQRLWAAVSAFVCFGFFALLPTGAIQILAVYGFAAASPVLAGRLIAFTVGESRKRKNHSPKSRRSYSGGTVVACNALLALTGMLVALLWISWAPDDRIGYVLGGGGPNDPRQLPSVVKEWVEAHWLKVFSAASAVSAVAAFGPRANRTTMACTAPRVQLKAATRIRAWCLLIAPLPLTMIGVMACPSTDAAADLYCSPFSIRSAKTVIVFNGLDNGKGDSEDDERTRESARERTVRVELEHFAIKGSIQYVNSNEVFAKLNSAHPESRLTTPLGFETQYRAELRDRSDLPRLRASLAHLQAQGVLVQVQSPCHKRF